VLLCAYSGKRTLAQGWKRRDKETRERGGAAYKPVALQDDKEEEGTEMPVAGEMSVATAVAGENAAGGGGGAVAIAGDDAAARTLAEEIALESATPPFSSLLRLGVTWLTTMGLSLLKGGHGAPSLLGVTCGTPGYWAVVGLNIPVLAFLTLLAGKAVSARHARRLACGYEYVEGDVQWSDAKVWQFAGYVGVGAIAAGMLGVGGGMILGPIFNELEFLPQVSSATSTIMVFFMSSANVGQFVVFGMLDLKYALFYGTFGGVAGAIVGTKGAKALIERTGRASYLIFFLAAILLGSGVLMAYAGIPQIIKSGLTGFRPICGLAGAAARKVD
jgi:uncharacterized membrane protein YfcA